MARSKEPNESGSPSDGTGTTVDSSEGKTAKAALVIEVAEHRRAEAALARSHEHLRAANAALVTDNAERRRAEAFLLHSNEYLRVIDATLVAENAEHRRAGAGPPPTKADPRGEKPPPAGEP